MFFFFFQAEDGIRDLTVTGVQTCALPISAPSSRWTGASRRGTRDGVDRGGCGEAPRAARPRRASEARLLPLVLPPTARVHRARGVGECRVGALRRGGARPARGTPPRANRDLRAERSEER